MKNILYPSLLLFFFSCADRNMKDYAPKVIPEEGKEVSFTKDINPIIQNKCVDCHKSGSNNPNSPMDYFFTTYEGVKIKVDERYEGSSRSKLLDRIKSSDPSFRMPYLLDPLTEEQIATIESWVKQGAKNN